MAEEAKTPNYTTLVLGGLLIVAAFFIGTMWTKIQTLEKTVKNGGTVAGEKAAAEATPAPTAKAEVTGETVGEVVAVSDQDNIKGSKDAQIVLIEYSDFQCPFCSRFNPIMQQVMQEYGDKVAWVYRHFPLSFHAYAQELAEASECAAEQGLFWEFADAAYAVEEVDANTATTVATNIGLNMTDYNSCMDNGKYTQKVKDQASAGQKAGISGTPGTILMTKNGDKELISGALPFEQIKQVIDKYLQ